jgi:hypothetical protein
MKTNCSGGNRSVVGHRSAADSPREHRIKDHGKGGITWTSTVTYKKGDRLRVFGKDCVVTASSRPKRKRKKRAEIWGAFCSGSAPVITGDRHSMENKVVNENRPPLRTVCRWTARKLTKEEIKYYVR